MLILYDVNSHKYLLKSTDYYSLNLELRMILSISIEIYFVILIISFVIYVREYYRWKILWANGHFYNIAIRQIWIQKTLGIEL